MKPISPCLPALLIIAFTASLAVAGSLAFGPRMGYTHDHKLNQIHIGAHATVAKLTPNIQVMPSLDIGFGKGTLYAINGDILYEFTELASRRWSYYAGGGPFLSHYSRRGKSSTDVAFNIAVGVTRELKPDLTVLGEVRLGLEDAPVLKITTGLTFY